MHRSSPVKKARSGTVNAEFGLATLLNFKGRREIMRKFRFAALALTSGTLFAGTAHATDIMPGDYTVLPAGTNLALLYGVQINATQLNVDNVGKVPDSELQATFTIARYVRYEKIGSLPVVVEAILPIGGYHDVRIGGVTQPTKNGIGDLIVAFAAYPIHTSDPKYGTTVGFTTYVTTPTGAYDPAKISFGSGTYTITPQLALMQGLGKGLVLDAAADVAFTVNHTENGVQYSVKPAYQLQAYLRKSVSPTATVSFGYSGHFGGKQEVNNSYTGLRSSSHQLRLFASNFFTKTLQVQAMVGADVASAGGFRQGFNGQIRLLKLF